MFSLQEKHKKIMLALFIAILLWTYANNQANNLFSFGEEKNESFIVDLEYRNLDDKYRIKSISGDKAVIRIDYVSYLVQLDKEDINAYIDLKDVSIGDNIKIIEVNVPTGARLISIDPGYVVVNIEEK
ncbi:MULTISPECIES: hypothetical protein [unclassified Halanaerobium]|uniref:hypothetical protein n=1 Tax=unclassified Halanaerobium TaxID=2641197 RepID=UPI000DF2D2FD|nr:MULTISPECIES: hypothetical protein [unclassified Halanaerobium]RCW49276.1 hypothetical protein DFR78_10682 [Halanaerobium sp. MA284_MarDTE_T2]RCW84015.1 hypothetical protein DER71_11540 [Halanaerobium sp. DL-01]